MLRSTTTIQQQHSIWMCEGSFFWMQLRKIKPLFDFSTYWQISTGVAISYWFDSWTTPTMASIDAPLPANRKWSLEKAIQNGLQATAILHTSSEDRIQWQFTKNDEYSAKSFYDVKIAEGRIACQFQFIWNLKIPPTVRVFAFLCIHDKLLTHEKMITRGFQCAHRCQVCQVHPL